MRTAVALRIAGRVQGVGYRDWMVAEAQARGVDGWVRNRPDGSVEAVIAGPKAAVAATIEACRRGPFLARVVGIDTDPAEDPGPGFRRPPMPR